MQPAWAPACGGKLQLAGLAAAGAAPVVSVTVTVAAGTRRRCGLRQGGAVGVLDVVRVQRALVLERVRRGLSQERLASRLGVTRQGLAQWESTRNDPKLSTLLKWSAALRVDLAGALVSSPALVDADSGEVVHVDVSRHAAVVGSGRRAVLFARALAGEYPSPVTLTVGLPFASRLDASRLGDVASELAESAASGVSRVGVLAVCVDGLTPGELDVTRECLARARSARWAVVVVGRRLDAEWVSSLPVRVELGAGSTAWLGSRRVRAVA